MSEAPGTWASRVAIALVLGAVAILLLALAGLALLALLRWLVPAIP